VNRLFLFSKPLLFIVSGIILLSPSVIKADDSSSEYWKNKIIRYDYMDKQVAIEMKDRVRPTNYGRITKLGGDYLTLVYTGNPYNSQTHNNYSYKSEIQIPYGKIRAIRSMEKNLDPRWLDFADAYIKTSVWIIALLFAAMVLQ
jgi:hypothetical protein